MEPQVIETTLKIIIPEDKVIIDKTEYQKLKQDTLAGMTWTVNDLRNQLAGMSLSDMKEKFLYPYREMLDVANGGFVKYPKKQGQQWKFNANEMSKFLDERWTEIMT